MGRKERWLLLLRKGAKLWLLCGVRKRRLLWRVRKRRLYALGTSGYETVETSSGRYERLEERLIRRDRRKRATDQALLRCNKARLLVLQMLTHWNG